MKTISDMNTLGSKNIIVKIKHGQIWQKVLKTVSSCSVLLDTIVYK